MQIKIETLPFYLIFLFIYFVSELVPDLSTTRFVNQGTSKTTKELIFTPRQYGGHGIQKVSEFWNSSRITWLKKTYHSNASWHNVLTESISGNKNYLIHFFGNFIREHFRHQLKTLLDGGTQSIVVSQETQIYFWI